MKRNKIIGALVFLIAIVYPFIVNSLSPAHYEASGQFLTYVFAPVLAVFGVLIFINMKAGMYYARIVVGSLFIVSGLIKANDALGFSYKLEEYFEPGALGWSVFEPYALILAIIACVAEVLLGLSLIFGTKFKLTMIGLLMLLIGFAFLTYYTAQCDPNGKYEIVENGITVEKPVQCVLDCGCFGDALKGSIGRSLTPWESFYKDFVLLILALFLLLGWNKIKMNNERRDRVMLSLSLVGVAFFGGFIFGWWFPLYFTLVSFLVYYGIKKFYSKPAREWVIAGLMTLFATGFALYTLKYLPIKDYRPYAIGNNLSELRMTSDDIKNKLIEEYTPSILATYSNKIEEDIKKAIALDTSLQSLPLLDGYSKRDSIIEDIKFNVTSTYEDIAWNIADSMANDSMERGNLFPPVYAVNYLLRNKETGEDKEFSSIEYLEQKLWNDWFTVYTLINEATGDVQKVLADDYKMEEWEAKGYTKQDPLSYKVKDGYEPKIPADFTFGSDEIDQHILSSKNYIILMVAYDLKKTKVNNIEKVKKLYQFAKEKGYTFYAASSSNAADFIAEHNLPFDFLGADDKILKTMIRSNPGIMLLKGGIVKGKWSNASIPNPKKLEKFISKQ